MVVSQGFAGPWQESLNVMTAHVLSLPAENPAEGSAVLLPKSSGGGYT
jgi:hypothetical protein